MRCAAALRCPGGRSGSVLCMWFLSLVLVDRAASVCGMAFRVGDRVQADDDTRANGLCGTVRDRQSHRLQTLNPAEAQELAQVLVEWDDGTRNWIAEEAVFPCARKRKSRGGNR